MRTSAKTKSSGKTRAKTSSVKGDVARAMFARWEKDHLDPKPVSWPKFKATLEGNRLREAPLFGK